MADQIDVSAEDTNAAHVKTFFRVSASALSFEVISHEQGQAELYFSNELKFLETSFFKISLGATTHIEITQRDGNRSPQKATLNTPNLLTNEFRQFWVTWNKGIIRLGRAGESTPFFEFKSKSSLNDFKYFVPAEGTTSWKFDLGPKLPKTKCYMVTGGEPQWMQAEDGLPLGAVIGGHENEPLHVIRAKHRGSLTPGKFVPSEGTGYISWGGNSHDKEVFEVLVGFNLEWVPTCEDRIPNNALPGGHSEVNREVLYIGRAEMDGHLVVGKVQPSHKVLYVPYQDKEVAKKNYEILVKPTADDARKVILVRKPSVRRHPFGHGKLLRKGQVVSTLNRQACMKQCMTVEEACRIYGRNLSHGTPLSLPTPPGKKHDVIFDMEVDEVEGYDMPHDNYFDEDLDPAEDQEIHRRESPSTDEED